MKSYVIGIDTSAYTTSLAVADISDGTIVYDGRRVLLVPEGQKGLRQQEAVFQHVNNMADLFEECMLNLNMAKAVSVSIKPRSVEGSYMPVFTVGYNYARVLSKTLNIPLYKYSHQENHIAAALRNTYKTLPKDEEILSIHISGGTSEFLITSKDISGYKVSIVGGTLDITFGQLIDRIGIAMGFPFPCGAHMDVESDDTAASSLKIPKISGREYINLSGMENYFKDLYLSGANKRDVTATMFRYIGMCIVHIIRCISQSHNFRKIAVTGGVSANTTVRSILERELSYTLIFPEAPMSSDNAVGNACLPVIDRWYNETQID